MKEEKVLIDPGSGIVVRGIMLLTFMTLLVLGGYFLLVRRPAQTPPAPLVSPEKLIGSVMPRQNQFPSNIAWGELVQFSDALPDEPGWQVRYTAVRNLARRGSTQVPWNVFRQLLDEHRQMNNFRIKLNDGKVVADEATARQIIVSGLLALAEWHKLQDPAKTPVPDDLRQVYQAVDVLAQSPILELRTQAEKAKATFFK